MLRYLLRRLALIPVALGVVNLVGFSYAYVALRFQQAQNPWGSAAVGQSIPIVALYRDYIGAVLRGDLGQMPAGVTQTVAQAVVRAAGASLGLLALTFGLSAVIGLSLGFWAVKLEPARIAPWLVPVSAVGLALPGFYVGILGVTAVILATLRAGPDAQAPLPLMGFGWDVHLILPVLALIIRPTAQIAQVTAGLLSGEMNRQYIVAARSRGNPWSRARWKHALSNVLAPLTLTLAGTWRLLIGEQILVEWFFAWPGLGQLLAVTLVPPRLAGPGGLGTGTIYFLHPPLVAALLTAFALVFLAADLLVGFLVRRMDPRLQPGEGEAA